MHCLATKKRHLKQLILFGLLLAFSLAAIFPAGCGGDTGVTQPTPGETGTAGKPPAGEKASGELPAPVQELVIGIGRNFYEGPDSATYLHGSTAIWESLTYLDEQMVPQPQLAESLVPEDGGKTWNITLRQGIEFHDGTPLNAAAVLANLERIQANPKYDPYGTFLNLEGFAADGEYGVTISFTRPEPAFDMKAAYHGFAIFSPHSFDDEGLFVAPYATGPFKFADYIKDEALILERNDAYRGEKARLDKVIFKPIPDPSTRLAALQAGEIHVIADVGGVLPEQAGIVEADPSLKLNSLMVTTSHYLLMNNTKPPFDNKLWREVVSLNLDRRLIVDQIVEGYGEPATSIFTPLAETWVVKENLWPTDREKAAGLAAAYSGAPPPRLTFAVSSALANRWPYKSIAEVLQAELNTLGLEVEIQMMEAGAWVETLRNGDYHLTLTPYTFMTGDPDFYFGRWTHSAGQMNISRGVGYNNPEADRLVEAAAVAGELAERQRLYRELQYLVAEDIPVAPVYQDVSLYATRSDVQDFSLDIFFRPSLETAWLADS